MKNYSVSKKPITLVKLGGSLITNKDESLTVDYLALRKVARSIAKSGLPSKERNLILVHGGGSFGHFYAKKYGLSTKISRPNSAGISMTTSAMFDLHSKVLMALSSSNVATETILPSELLLDDSISALGENHLRECFDQGLIPISFGFVGLLKKGAYIISGDRIVEVLSRALPVTRVIFAMDVDGIFEDSAMKGPVISRLSVGTRFVSKKRRYDVTGGIDAKVKLGLRISRAGREVFYVNGRKEERLSHLLSGKSDPVATAIFPDQN